MNKFTKVIAALIPVLMVGCQQSTNNSSSQAQTQSTPKSSVTYKEWHWPNLDASSSSVALNNDVMKKNYIVVFDDSGSMGGGKIKNAKIAVNRFLDVIPSDINVALSTLNKGLIVNFTNNRKILKDKLGSVHAGGGTPLYSAITKSFNAITTQGKKQLGYGQYGMIIVTDGEADAGEDPTRIVNQIVDSTPIEMHTIGFQLGNNHSLNQRGRTFYSTASDIDGLVNAMKSAVAESDSFDDAVTTFE